MCLLPQLINLLQANKFQIKKGIYAAGAVVARRLLPCTLKGYITKVKNPSSAIIDNSPGLYGPYRVGEIANFPQLACFV